MGFYGNITSATKTGFSFDRIYPNRRAMEVNTKSDNVYIGRYVLVDYDSTDENIPFVYKKDSEDKFLYLDKECQNKVLYESIGEVQEGEQRPATGISTGDFVQTKYGETRQFYICTGYEADEETFAEYAIFNLFSSDYNYGVNSDFNDSQKQSSSGNYPVNYNIDAKYWRDWYNAPSIGRGWDSTVWQKVYENGVEGYVMIAELNSVVPTFELSADAPTLTPITPHFDEVSSNTYYQIHWQPQWGLRVKHANATFSNKPGKSPSDESMTWIKNVYNQKDHITETYFYYEKDGEKGWKIFKDLTDLEESGGLLPAAIYYNKKGFDPQVHYSSSEENSFTLNPSGLSQSPSYDQNGNLVWRYNEYNDHTERGKKTIQPDTQELSMILPAFGNAVNDMWDIVYGKGVSEDGDIIHSNIKDRELNRLTFTDWEDGISNQDTPRMRLIHDNGADGFTYSQKEMSTLAGCINTAHDLMGMIIINQDEFPENLDELDDDKIYYNKNGYYRKIYSREFIPMLCIMEQVEIEEKDYIQNYYYYTENSIDLNTINQNYKNAIKANEDNQEQLEILRQEYLNNFILDIDQSYSSSRVYYVQKIYTENPNIYKEYEEIELNQYEQYKYYYTSGDSFICDKDKTVKNIQYYELSKENEQNNIVKCDVDLDFETNKYHEKVSIPESVDQVGYEYYIKTEDTYPENGKDYYLLDDSKKEPALIMLQNENYYDFDAYENNYVGQELTYFWSPGAFAVRVDTEQGEENYEFTAMDAEFDPNTQYYLLKWGQKLIPNPTPGIKDEIIPQIEKTGDGRLKAYKVNLINLEDENADTYYYYNEEDKSYKILTQKIIDKEYLDLGYGRILNNLSDNNISLVKNQYYYNVDVVTLSKDRFYKKGAFYYKEFVGHCISEDRDKYSYLKDNNEKITKGREYFTFDKNIFEAIENEFYMPNKYYYESNELQDFIIDKSLEKEPNRQYFKKNLLYVYSDLLHIYAEGSVWNKEVSIIPSPITLAKDKEKVDVELLNGFGRKLNTINGLIVQINKILSYNDTLTRDRNTVQGAINSLNDILDRFDKLIPNQIAIADSYGRLHTAETETDEWLEVRVKSDPSNPIIELEHLRPLVKKDVNLADINLNTSTKDSFELETTNIDNKGHVINFNKTKVILPNSYRTITDGVNSSIAQNAKDLIQFNGDDWVKVLAAQGQISFSHKTAKSAVNTAKQNISNLSFGDTFTLEDYYFDEKGHNNEIKTHTVKIPGLTYTSDNTGNILSNLSYTFNVSENTGKFTEVKENLGDLKLLSYQKANSSLSIGTDDTLSSALGKIEYKLDTLIGSDENKSARTISIEEINKELVPTNAITALNSVDKIAAYIQTIPNLLSNTNNSISGEATARQNADNALSQSISNEITARENANNTLNQNINNEITARQNADEALSQSISSEASARENADKALSNRIKIIEDTEYVLKSTYDAKILELEQKITNLEAAINTTT